MFGLDDVLGKLEQVLEELDARELPPEMTTPSIVTSARIADVPLAPTRTPPTTGVSSQTGRASCWCSARSAGSGSSGAENKSE